MTVDTTLKKQLLDWIENYLEVPDSARGDWAPCPYARQARLDKKIEFVSCNPDEFTTVVNANLHLLDTSKDVIVVCFDHTTITPDNYYTWEQDINAKLNPYDYAILGQHPDDEGAANDNRSFTLSGLILIQKLSKINAAAIKLFKSGYYNTWSKQHLDKVVSWRFNPYTVHQHWDPLKVCIVGRAYPPEYFEFVPNPAVRSTLEQIARETEEDFQQLIATLEKFNVKVLRPGVGDSVDQFMVNGKCLPPPVCPRDHALMLGSDFFIRAVSENTDLNIAADDWAQWRGESWPLAAPTTFSEYAALPDFVKKEIESIRGAICDPSPNGYYDKAQMSDIDKLVWGEIIDDVQSNFNSVINVRPAGVPFCFNSASAIRVGKDVYLGTDYYGQDLSQEIKTLSNLYPEKRFHTVDSGGHADGTFCVVKPGLVISLHDIKNHNELFPGWEVVYLPGASWAQVNNFEHLRKKNHGKFWLPNQELNDDFTEFVNSWLHDWVGHVEETVFDVNMLVIDENNVICSNYNQTLFEAFSRHNVTPHVVNFRHRYFWDGGIHCITNDVHRVGKLTDYFPNRNT